MVALQLQCACSRELEGDQAEGSALNVSAVVKEEDAMVE